MGEQKGFVCVEGVCVGHVYRGCVYIRGVCVQCMCIVYVHRACVCVGCVLCVGRVFCVCAQPAFICSSKTSPLFPGGFSPLSMVCHTLGRTMSASQMAYTDHFTSNKNVPFKKICSCIACQNTNRNLGEPR